MIAQHYTPDQVAEQLAISAKHVRMLIAAGELRASNIGGEGRSARWRVSESDLNRWLESRACYSPSAAVRAERRSTNH